MMLPESLGKEPGRGWLGWAILLLLVALTEANPWDPASGQLHLGDARRLQSPGLQSELGSWLIFCVSLGGLCIHAFVQILSGWFYEGVFLDETHV